MSNSYHLPYQPSFPADYRPGIGIIGCGTIVRQAHLPAYQKHRLNLVGAFDAVPAATAGLQEEFGLQRIYTSLDDLLADPAIEIVDVATFPEQRIPIMRRALEAGKHILAQKPLAIEMAQAEEIVAEAERRGLKVAVNQNGRWSPPWRIATLLLQTGIIGDVTAITHLFDINLSWVTGSRFDAIPHWLLYDYSIHWFDITRCWLAGKRVSTVNAREFRLPNQPADSKAAWGISSEIHCEDGANALLRCVGGSASQQKRHYFWLHGTQGTIRGCVNFDQFVELDNAEGQTFFDFEGAWFPDGFAGTMGELIWAIYEDREPYNSARHHLASLAITLAACESAEGSGQSVQFDKVI